MSLRNSDGLHREEHGRHVDAAPHAHSTCPCYQLHIAVTRLRSFESPPFLPPATREINKELLDFNGCHKRDNRHLKRGENSLRNMEAGPLPQRCSNGIRQCHVTRCVRKKESPKMNERMNRVLATLTRSRWLCPIRTNSYPTANFSILIGFMA